MEASLGRVTTSMSSSKPDVVSEKRDEQASCPSGTTNIRGVIQRIKALKQLRLHVMSVPAIKRTN